MEKNLNLLVEQINEWIENKELISESEQDCYHHFQEYFELLEGKLKERFPLINNLENMKVKLFSVKLGVSSIHLSPYISIILEINDNAAYFESCYDLEGNPLDQYIISPEHMEHSH